MAAPEWALQQLKKPMLVRVMLRMINFAWITQIYHLENGSNVDVLACKLLKLI
jgi:hypothetical protein